MSGQFDVPKMLDGEQFARGDLSGAEDLLDTGAPDEDDVSSVGREQR